MNTLKISGLKTCYIHQYIKNESWPKPVLIWNIYILLLECIGVLNLYVVVIDDEKSGLWSYQYHWWDWLHIMTVQLLVKLVFITSSEECWDLSAFPHCTLLLVSTQHRWDFSRSVHSLTLPDTLATTNIFYQDIIGPYYDKNTWWYW